MTAFDQLHPSLQHHIVNSLGWRELRAFQHQVIPLVLAGSHALVIAPTAGGKTEAAIFPMLSRMLSENWRGLTVLYLCPTRALLNNLHPRLQRYAQLLGRTCSLWHGDSSPAQRAQITADPPDILLTTPESLELMLVSRKIDSLPLFASIQAVIIDELHAFAADDRGCHLLSVLARIARLSNRDPQRIGLSATVGNPSELLSWLTAGSVAPAATIHPADPHPVQPEVQLDFTGSLKNAAVIISRLHRGEKRLVFVDSRARAEQLAIELRNLEVQTFVSHSSLSKDQRLRTQEAFISARDCVIVATSSMELGVDIGDLDRVIQIDAPASVAGFLQRMGRTGRRPDTRRNCLFLATAELPLLQAAALIQLWSSGFIENITPPPLPYHVLVQQLLALTLQSSDFSRHDCTAWIGSVPAFATMPDTTVPLIFDHLISANFLCQDNGQLILGPAAECKLGYKHYCELLSVITSAPLMLVRHGRSDIGSVHPDSLLGRANGPHILSLAGHGWKVNHIDWKRKIVHVEPSPQHGRSRWTGSSSALSPSLCAAMREALTPSDPSPLWSKRAAARITELRQALSPLVAPGTCVLPDGQSHLWWTFAGIKANATLAQYLRAATGHACDPFNLWLRLPEELSLQEFSQALETLRHQTQPPAIQFSRSQTDLLKFADLLPPSLLHELLLARQTDHHRAQQLLQLPIHIA